jgi:hypothetical protein
MPRHLFSGDDYTNRPGSSYKMKNIVGQAMEEFTSAISQPGTASTNTTNRTGIGGAKDKRGNSTIVSTGGIQNKDNNITDYIQKT